MIDDVWAINKLFLQQLIEKKNVFYHIYRSLEKTFFIFFYSRYKYFEYFLLVIFLRWVFVLIWIPKCLFIRYNTYFKTNRSILHLQIFYASLFIAWFSRLKIIFSFNDIENQTFFVLTMDKSIKCITFL